MSFLRAKVRLNGFGSVKSAALAAFGVAQLSASTALARPDARCRDLYFLWSEGKYFRIFYSRAKVEAVEKGRVMLEPK